MTTVSVIIPVYNAFSAAKDCLLSVLENLPEWAEVLVIDDASPSGIFSETLEEKTRLDPRLKLLRNEKNLGFVGTCNRAMLLLTEGDIVLLNSDTLVTPGWLEKLKKAAYSSPNVGTVTPLTNNGTICSVPVFLENNSLPPGFSLQQVSELVESHFTGDYPEVPTCVGFCTYVTRKFLEQVGGFDPMFGKGYGEENDLSQRAITDGFINIIDTATFIYHAGNMSFVETRELLSQENSQILHARYPHYEHDVALFCANNPLNITHSKIWNSLTTHYAKKQKKSVLHVLHNGPFKPRRHACGGTELHVQSLIKGIPDLLHYSLVPQLNSYLLTTHLPAGDRELHLPLWFDLETLFKQDYFDLVHLHHTIGFDLPKLSKAILAHQRYVVSVHDYWPLCDRIFLRTPDGKVCDGANCELSCATTNGSIQGKREIFQELYAGAKQVLCFSDSTNNIVSKNIPGKFSWKKIHHGISLPQKDRAHKLETTSPTNPLKVLFLGTLVPHKGLPLIEDLTKFKSLKNGTPIQWHFLGASEGVKIEGLTDHGRYSSDSIVQSIQKIAPHFIAILPLCQETYSITLDDAIFAGVPVIVTSFGALPERVKEWDVGYVLPEPTPGAALDLMQSALEDFESYTKKRNNTFKAPLITIDQEIIEYKNLYEKVIDVSKSETFELLNFLQPGLVGISDLKRHPEL